MPSTNKTQVLSLNKWIATDHPKREDFVNDNVLIDNAIALTFKNINLSNNVITFTRFNNTTYKVNLPKLATNSENGLISYNKVKELFNEKYEPKERDINNKFSTVNGKIETNKGSIEQLNNKVNVLNNDNTSNKAKINTLESKVQIQNSIENFIANEESSKLITDTVLKNIFNSLFANETVLKFIPNMSVNKNDIIYTITDNKLYLYKAKENISNVSIINDKFLKLKLGSGASGSSESIDEIKKKLLAG